MSNLPTPEIFEPASAPAPESSPIPQNHSQPHRRRWIFFAGGFMVLLLAGGAVGYAAWEGYLPNPFMKRPTPENILSAFSSLQSAQTHTQVTLALQPRDADVAVSDFSLFTGSEKDNAALARAASLATGMMSSDLLVELAVDAQFSDVPSSQTLPNEEMHITGNYTANNVSAFLDITTRVVDEVMYVQPAAIPLPIPFLDMQALKDQWVSFGETENDRAVFTKIPSNTSSDSKEDVADPEEEVRVFLREGIAQGALVFSEPKRISSEQGRVWQSTLVIDGEKLHAVIKDIGARRDDLFPEVTQFYIFDDALIETSNKERAKDIYREIFSHTTASITLTSDFQPATLMFTTRIAPKSSEASIKDRQIMLRVATTFSHINEPIVVTAPSNAISAQKAGALLLGTSEELFTVKEQTSTIDDLRDALAEYYKDHKAYPQTLNELMGVEYMHKTVTNIPNDIFTNTPYSYTATVDTYTLTFSIPQDLDAEIANDGDVVSGTNTATPEFASQEYAEQTDADEDGLSLAEETHYGTRDSRADSDSDGYSDKEEISAGYNPLGSGKLSMQE